MTEDKMEDILSPNLDNAISNILEAYSKIEDLFDECEITEEEYNSLNIYLSIKIREEV